MLQDAVLLSNLSATPASFALIGGLYQVNVLATWGGGSVVFNQLGPDGSTWVAISQTFSANGGGTYYIPPGSYQLAITTATGVYAQIARIPMD